MSSKIQFPWGQHGFYLITVFCFANFLGNLLILIFFYCSKKRKGEYFPISQLDLFFFGILKDIVKAYLN